MRHNDIERWRVFFDDLAPRWDAREDLVAVRRKLLEGFEELGVGPAERILDVGCGTGNLTEALLTRLDPSGEVIAVDISTGMLDIAREKVRDPRVRFLDASSHDLPLPDGSLDRVFCLHVWPHLADCDEHVREFGRCLRDGGLVHVWHLVSRADINAIHGGSGDDVRHDVLGPGTETAACFERNGFTVEGIVDDEERYLVTARKRVRL